MTRHLVLLLALAALAAPAAHADGLPVLGVDVGSSGVSSPQSAVRYVTIPAGASTLVERVRRDGGQVLGSTFQPGTFTIPAVAYDRSAGGLSGDGRTLVLIEPRVGFPRATIVAAYALRAAGLIQREGAALSPYAAKPRRVPSPGRGAQPSPSARDPRSCSSLAVTSSEVRVCPCGSWYSRASRRPAKRWRVRAAVRARR